MRRGKKTDVLGEEPVADHSVYYKSHTHLPRT